MQNFFPNSARLIVCASFLTLVHLPSVLTAQSRIISADPGVSGGGPASRTIQFGNSFENHEVTTRSPTSKSEKRMEQILNMPFDGEYYEVPFIRVMEQLRDNYGINVILDQSARDDSLTEDDPITFQASGIRLNNALNLILKEKNATFIAGDNTLQIISLDVANDPDYFISEFYPIDSLSTGNYGELVEDIKASIDPQDWYDAGGDAHINYLSVNGRPSLSLFAPHATHRLLREYLANIAQITTAGATRQLATSQVIQLPLAKVKKRPKKKKGYGIGGFGGGGGMF